MVSRFDGVEQGPPIEVFALNKKCTDDPCPNKVNLGVGAYRDEAGKPWVLPVVRKVEKQISADDTLLHEYLPILEPGNREIHQRHRSWTRILVFCRTIEAHTGITLNTNDPSYDTDLYDIVVFMDLKGSNYYQNNNTFW